MASKSLPAYLQQVLENHVAKSELSEDEELRDLFQRLSKLNENVEKVKSTIMQKRMNKLD